MYRAFVEEGKPEAEIARTLNEKSIATDWGGRGRAGPCTRLLTNEKYIGNNVYNRVSFKLKKKRVTNPPEMWIRRDTA